MDDPVALEDTIHEMANSLTRLGTDEGHSHIAAPRTGAADAAAAAPGAAGGPTGQAPRVHIFTSISSSSSSDPNSSAPFPVPVAGTTPSPTSAKSSSSSSSPSTSTTSTNTRQSLCLGLGLGLGPPGLGLAPQYTCTLSPPASPERDTGAAASPTSTRTFIPWPALDGEATYIRPSLEFLQRRPSTRNSMQQPQHPGRRMSIASSRHTRSSSTASASSSPYVHGASPFPAPSKPLPAVPPSLRSSSSSNHNPPSSGDRSSPSDRSSSHYSYDNMDYMDRFSQSSSTASDPSRSSFQSLRIRPPIPPRPPEHLRPGHHLHPRNQMQMKRETTSTTSSSSPPPPALSQPSPHLEVVYWKQLHGAERRKSGKTNMIYYLDMSEPSATVATKHGNSVIKFWSLATGSVKSTVKISSYVEPRTRCRDYMIRSHSILSEAAQMAAIATRFGRSIEIWNWDRHKRLQVIDDADRWVAGRFESYDSRWTPLAAYRGKDNIIDLFAATTREKKPFAKVRTIDLRKAGLPLIPQYPELALSSTSPLLVVAAGPRTPRAGRPPPDRETLLVTWDIEDYRETSHTPHRVVRPWQHKELETALPCGLFSHGDLVVSLWIPAGYRTVATPAAGGGGMEYTLAPTAVPFRYVLVWDLSENSTRTYGIPNTVSCISPDCRFVAYCHVAERRTKLAILDAQSGDELWAIGGEGNLESLTEVGDLSKVTELAFSGDGRLLLIGDVEGNTSVYDVREATRRPSTRF